MDKKLKVILIVIFISVSRVLPQSGILRFEHLTVDDGLSQNSVFGIVKDKYGFMWFGTWEGICRYDGYKFTIFRADESNPTALTNNRVNSVYKDSLQDIWVATSDTRILFKYHYETESFIRFPVAQVIRSIRDSLQRAHVFYRSHAKSQIYEWLASRQCNCLRQFDLKTGASLTYKTDAGNTWSLNDDMVTDIYQDDNDILWVGTLNGGINKADLRSKPFISYSNTSAGNNSLVENVVRAIYQDPAGSLWIGSENKGITKIDRRNNTYTYYRNIPGNSNSLLNNEIRYIYRDRFGYMWFGTKGGLDRFDPRSGLFFHYSVNADKKIPHNWVFWIMEDHSGYLWIGTFNGIAKYNRKTDSFLAFNPETTLNNRSVRMIIEDRNNYLWVATEGGGITKLTRDSSNGFNEKLTPVHFTYSPTNPNSLINNQVLAMLEDEDGYFWIGTNSGLCMFDQYKMKFTRLSVKTGLPDDLIMSILSDGKGYIWISHKKGISRIDKKSLELRNFDLHDGLQGNEFSQNACFRNKSTNEMFFGGINGFNSFFPDSIKDNPFPPKVVFTGLQVSNNPVLINLAVNGRVILKKSLLLTKEITLTHGDKNFSVEFAALHYSNPKGNKYKYKLENYDNAWISTDAFTRRASYSDLPANTYYLKVLASNSDGLWSTEPAILKIIVLPPWWLTWWAYFIYFTIIGLIFFFSYKYIESKIQFRNQLLIERLKVEKEKELAQMKMQFFTNVSHEFRTPLSLIIDPLERLISEKIPQPKAQNYYTLMYKNAQRLLSLINQLLDFRKVESGNLQLKPSMHDIVPFVKNIIEAFEFHARQRNIQFSFNTGLESLPMAFDSEKLDKIIYNLLSNAFKYTSDGGKIELDLYQTQSEPDENGFENFVVIKVSDNGIGISASYLDKIFDVFYQVDDDGNKPQGTGIGLALTKELVKLHKGNIAVKSEVGKGSLFIVFLPLIPDAENTVTSPAYENEGKNFTHRHTNPNLLLEEDITPDQPINVDTGENHHPLVLLVDDNTDVRAYLRSNLEDNYQVVEAKNGPEGVARAIELVPDLIISDIMMPGIDGIELCRKLKTDEHTSHIPIILLTARQSDEYKIEGYETGADAYLTKPFNTVILKSRIKNLLYSRQRLRELFSKGSSFEVKKIAINVTDEAFINKVLKLIDENMSETNFDTDALAGKLRMSRSQLYRKIKALTNQTVHDFITTFRMNKAAELLLNGELSISEVAYKVGYTLHTNFTRSFVKQFGETPSKYIEAFRKGK